jgi:hypothetical protein
VANTAQRRAVVENSPELQERERTKFAEVTDAMAGALRQRGTAAPGARLLAEAGTAVFQAAFARWADQPEQTTLGACAREAAAELAAGLGRARDGTPPGRYAGPRRTEGQMAAGRLGLGEFAFPGPLRDQLVGAILDGAKTTTTGLLDDYARDGEPLARPGDLPDLLRQAQAEAETQDRAETQDQAEAVTRDQTGMEAG